ncbi:MAG TPA: cyclic nucleotide-binding domain-containing protein, partial [Chitinophagaceae bacterium]|nr:cyclic nucleotide-binding domain-containing protein [Chitinophagaceae bacterium]
MSPASNPIFRSFYAYTAPLVQFTGEEEQLLESCFQFRQVPKKSKLAEEGKVARELYFINKGLLRLYYTKDGVDITAYIFKEGLFASSHESFLRQSPGIQTLETLEDCELLVITYSGLNRLYELVPKMNVLVRKVAEQRFINAQLILSSYILDSPEERYRKFAAEHGDLLLKVPHHMIAS